MTPRFRRHHPATSPSPPGADRELREAVAAAMRQTARFRYRSAVADPFDGNGSLGGWEDEGLVDFRGPAAWYRRVWLAPGTGEASGETVGVLGATGLATLRPDGTVRETHGAPHLVNATSNPVGLLRLLDPAFTSAAPAGPGRWRIAIDLHDAQQLLGSSAFGPGTVRLGTSLPATAQLAGGRPEVVAVQTGVWGEPHAWAAVRFTGWGTPVPRELEELSVADADFGAVLQLLAA